jgi:hypothetical protein
VIAPLSTFPQAPGLPVRQRERASLIVIRAQSERQPVALHLPAVSCIPGRRPVVVVLWARALGHQGPGDSETMLGVERQRSLKRAVCAIQLQGHRGSLHVQLRAGSSPDPVGNSGRSVGGDRAAAPTRNGANTSGQEDRQRDDPQRAQVFSHDLLKAKR